MKKLFIVFAVLGFLIAAPAYAALYGFDSITNTIAGDAAIGEAQLSVEVTDESIGSLFRVGFTFANSGPEPSSIADVFFDDDSGILFDFIFGGPFFNESTGVDFEVGASPGNLPGGNDFGFAANFVADSEPPAQQNGVNPGETLGIQFDIEGSFDNSTEALNSVVAAMNSRALRIGIHVQGFDSGGSEGFINSVSSVPEPAAMLLLGGGLICFAVVGRKKFFKK